MIGKRVFFFLLLGLLMVGCQSYDYEISSLKYSRIKFDDLPEAVKSFYIDPSQFGFNSTNASLIEFACLDPKETLYSLETIKTRIGPWVAYDKLKDEKRNISYRINQGTPIPYVVFQNKLYLTDEFNVFTLIKDYSTLEFTCYALIDK